MELNKAPSPSQYTPTILSEAAKSTLDDEENNIAAAGANAGTGAATDADTYYTKEAELMMDEQLQEQRDEQHRDDQNAQLNNWQLQNASFKA